MMMTIIIMMVGNNEYGGVADENDVDDVIHVSILIPQPPFSHLSVSCAPINLEPPLPLLKSTKKLPPHLIL